MNGFFKSNGQFTKKKAARWLIIGLLIAAFAVFTVQVNRTDKVQLVERAGQTFEKGTVVEILQDNLQPDGSRVGEQRVRVEMKTGERRVKSWR